MNFFLKLTPDISIITSVDPDHLDIYKDEQDMKIPSNLLRQIPSKMVFYW